MRIINTTSVFPKCHDSFDALERLAMAGYDGIDMAFDYCVQDKSFPFMTDKYEGWAYRLRERAEELGVVYTHSHASFDASVRGELVERTLRCASILGAKYLVVHPCCHIGTRELADDDEYIPHNAEMIKPLLEPAERYGIILLTENLLNGASNRVQVVSRLVEEVDSPWFGWCYDVGHAHSEGDSLENFRAVSVAPLSLHVHDNDGTYDEHLIPGYGNLDWKEFIHSLKAVGYKGDFVLEAHEQCKEAPDKERDTILRDILDRSRKMVEYYNSI